MSSRAEKLRKAYEFKLGKKIVSKLTDEQIKILSAFYNSLSETEQRNIDSDLFKGNANDLSDMANSFVEEQEQNDDTKDDISITSKKINVDKLLPLEVTEEVSEEVKDDAKEEIKDNIKEEVKEEIKEEVKDNIKEEVKEEVKEEKEKEEKKEEEKKDINIDEIAEKSSKIVISKIESGKIDVKKLLPLKDDEDKQKQEQKVLNSIVKELDSIKKSINSIIESFKSQSKLIRSDQEKQRIRKSREDKKSRESYLEKTDDDKDSKKAEKAIVPFENFFDRILNFFKFILLGGFLKGLLNIIKNPQIILKPIQDIINNVIGFFNGIIKWIDDTFIQPIRGMIDAVNSGLKALTDTINGIINSIPNWIPIKPDPIKDPVQIPQIPNLPDDGLIPEATFADVPSSSPVQSQQSGGQIINVNNNEKTVINAKDLSFKSGGAIDKNSGITISGLGPDTQLIAAQPGEVVINKKAADSYGVENLLSLNAVFGGPNANKPKTAASNKIKAMSSGGYAGRIKYFSVNGGGNKLLNPGQTYSYRDLRPHHSGPTTRRTDGYPKDYTLLNGTDLQTSPNSDVPVPLDSEVIYKGVAGGYGNTVVVKNATGNMLFAHLSRFGNFRRGTRIKAGTIIGTQGRSGGNYVDHLHLDAEPAGHEAFVNYITSGNPTYGSSSSAGEEVSQDYISEGQMMNRSSSIGIPEMDYNAEPLTILPLPLPDNKYTNNGATNSPNQSPIAKFSSIDNDNPHLFIVKAIYNIGG